MGVDPIVQSDCLLVGEATAGAFVAKALQLLDAISLIGAMPIANRVVVEQQRRRDLLAAPALIEKHDRIGSTTYAMLPKPIPSKPGQGSPVVSREKSAANHIPRRILFAPNVKPFLGFSMSRGIAPKAGVIGDWRIFHRPHLRRPAPKATGLEACPEPAEGGAPVGADSRSWSVPSLRSGRLFEALALQQRPTPKFQSLAAGTFVEQRSAARWWRTQDEGVVGSYSRPSAGATEIKHILHVYEIRLHVRAMTATAPRPLAGPRRSARASASTRGGAGDDLRHGVRRRDCPGDQGPRRLSGASTAVQFTAPEDDDWVERVREAPARE
jgi:hypothetical protein